MAGAGGRSQAKSLDRETRITKAKLGAELSQQLDKFWMVSWVLCNPDDEAIDNSCSFWEGFLPPTYLTPTL